MKKGFSIGQMVFLIVAAIVVFKVIIPKFMNKTGGGIAIYQAASELKTGIDDIRSYYFRNGKFTNIGIMTISAGFEDKDILFDFDRIFDLALNIVSCLRFLFHSTGQLVFRLLQLSLALRMCSP